MSKQKSCSSLSSRYSLDELFGLEGRVAVISGGAGKMGQEFAKTLSLAGCRVAIFDLEEDFVKNVAESLSEISGNQILGIRGDACNEDQVNDVFEGVRRLLGPVEIFIHNVMPKPDGYYKAFENYSVKTWNQVMQGGLTSALLCSRTASRDMIKRRKGSIVLTSSIYGVVGADQRVYADCSAEGNIYEGGDSLNLPAVYSTYKSGIISLTRHLAADWGKNNVRVNCLIPGGVYDEQEKSFHDAYVHRTPLGRMASWTDYNGAILFLVSDASLYMTGANLVVDGGWTCW